MALSVNPSLPVVAAQAAGGATTAVVLQPGTVVSAEVLQVTENLVQIAIANLTVNVLSEVPLTAGQTLQLAVSQAQDGAVRLAIVGQGPGPGAATAAAVTDTISIAPNASANSFASPATTSSIPVTTSSIPSDIGDALTPLERIAVSVAAGSAAAQQQSLAPLFANLGAAAASNSLPPALQQAVALVLSQQTNLDLNLSGSDIQQAFEASGLFLEASLASPADTLPAAGAPDLKAALIVLRQALASLPQTTEASVPTTPVTAQSSTANVPTAQPQPAPTGVPSVSVSEPQAAQIIQAAQTGLQSLTPAPSLIPESDVRDIPLPQAQLLLPAEAGATNPAPLLVVEALLSGEPLRATAGALVELPQEALQGIARAAGNAATTTIASRDGQSGQVVLRSAPPPPPFRGALPSAQPIATSSLPPNASLPTIVHRLLQDTDAALARQTLLQVASLPQRVDDPGARLDPTIPRWNFEIPFATPQGTAIAQFEISRDGGGNEVEATDRLWRARFSIDVEPTGPIHALITYNGARTSVRMWAERPATAAQLRAGVAELSQALSQAELTPGDIVIREGSPPQPAPAKAGHFLDRAL